MLKDWFIRIDKPADRRQTEERSRNPMPDGWQPPAEIPYHQFSRDQIPPGTSLPPQARPDSQGAPETPADADRPASPPPADSGE